MTRRDRKLTWLALGTLALALGAGGGATFAMWQSSLTIEGSVRDARTEFLVNGVSGSQVDVQITRSDLQTLLDTRSLAIPVEVDSLQQGNRGLQYTVTAPTAQPGSILSATRFAVFPVPSASACTTATAIPAAPTPSSSVPIPAVYSDSDTPVAEYWCIRADLTVAPDQGQFTSNTTVTATSATGSLRQDVPWSIQVLSAFDVDAEPDYRVSFAYQTFRENQ